MKENNNFDCSQCPRQTLKEGELCTKNWQCEEGSGCFSLGPDHPHLAACYKRCPSNPYITAYNQKCQPITTTITTNPNCSCECFCSKGSTHFSQDNKELAQCNSNAYCQNAFGSNFGCFGGGINGEGRSLCYERCPTNPDIVINSPNCRHE